MPNDNRHELTAPPELTADEVRDIANRAAAETEEGKAKSFDEIREAFALLKRADEIMARR
jgi:hypothetical protein